MNHLKTKIQVFPIKTCQEQAEPNFLTKELEPLAFHRNFRG